MLDTDPEQAAALAQQTLAAGVSLWLIEFLPALRERAPELADQLFEMALKVLLSQSNPADASQLHLLGSYITPASGNVNPQLARYFLSLMAAALQAQSDPSASSGRRLSLSEQQYLAQSYLPLFERYAPDLTPAIQALLNHISANMPSEQKQQTQPNPGSTPNGRSGGLGSGSEQEPQISSDNIGNVGDLLSVQETGDETAAPEDATASEAVIMRIRDEKQRQALLDARRYNAARKALKQDKLDEAHRLTQQIKDVSKQVDLLVELGQNIAGRNETDRALAFFDQAYQLISTLDDPRIKAFQMLTLARTALKLDRSRAIYYAQGGVTTLNRLHSSERATTDPMAELTRRQATRGQLEAIFAPLGRADFDQAIYLATQLLDTEQRILAEIAICRTVLEQAGKKSNP